MKITSFILNSLTIFLATIFITKIVFWLKTDEPISRGSMLILALFIVLLTVRNKYTYFLLGGLVLSCMIYKYTYHNCSGYLIVDFTASIRQHLRLFKKLLYTLPYVIYFLILVLMIFPSTRKLYFSTKNRNK